MGISLVTFAGQTVTPQDDALIYEAALLGSGLIYGGTVTLASANTLHIAAGHGALGGRKFTIEETDIPVALTPSGTLLGRVYIHMDLGDVDEPIAFMVETAESLTPCVQDPDINIVNGVYEINLATFDVDTSTISNLDNVAPVIESLNNALTNKADVSTVTALSNTSDTTSQSGTTLYKKSIALNHVYVDSPSVDIGSTGVLPTVAQQEAYNLLQYVTVDSAIPCLYLYASDIPTDSFYINVEGCD